MRKTVLLALLFCGSAALLNADTEVGRVVSLSGKVLIDAFGKGAFIPAIPGDALYQSSVLRTEPDGRALVTIQGRQREVPPTATVRVAEVLETSARQSGLGWLQALGNLMRSISEAGKQKQDDLVLGSRAADVGGADEGLGWMDEDEEAAELYAAAQGYIREQRYADALGRLTRIQTSSDQALLWNAAFWKGFCYFQFEDYGDAARYLGEARRMLGSTTADLGTPSTRRLLLFQLGASHYFLGEQTQAISTLDGYLAQRSGDPYEPYAVLFLAKALIASGDSRRAKVVLTEASARYKGQEIEKEIAGLLAGL